MRNNLMDIVEYVEMEKSYTLKKLERVKRSISCIYEEIHADNHYTAEIEFDYFQKHLVPVLEYLLNRLELVDLNSSSKNSTKVTKAIIEARIALEELIEITKNNEFKYIKGQDGSFELFSSKDDVIINLEYLFELIEK